MEIFKVMRRQNSKERDLFSELKELAFDVSETTNRVIDIGWALEFAKQYKVNLHGDDLMKVCADISEKGSVNPINPGVSQFSYGVFTEKPVEEIEAIFAFADTVEEAVCKCLINARKAGVI
jgi:hypothetical protein